MTRRPPRLGRWLLRLRPLGSRRDEVQADLEELFAQRARTQSPRAAALAYYRDVLSLWRWNPTGERIFHDAARDLRHGLRLFRRSPGSVSITIAGLALAIGVNTAVFSLLNATLLLRPGIANPDSVARVHRSWKEGVSSAWSYAEYAALRDASIDIRVEAISLLNNATRFSPTSPDSLNDDQQLIPTGVVGGTYMATLGARPLYGRILTADDDVPGAGPVTVLGHTFWKRRLAADPAVLGRRIWLNGTPATIVGIAHPGFTGIAEVPPALWISFTAHRFLYGDPPLSRSSTTPVNVVARAPAGMRTAKAEAQLGALAAALGHASSDRYRPTGAKLIPVGAGFAGSNPRGLLLILSAIILAVALVMLLACVNVANLQLASAAARQREIGIRLAVGASRARIVRQLVTESVVVGWLSGALALAMTIWFMPILSRIVRLPVTYDASPDGRVYALLLLLSCAAGIGSGLMPARHGTRGDLLTALKGDGPSFGSPGRPTRLRAGLVGVQAAASLLLLVLATLATRAAIQAAAIDVGFQPRHLLAASPGFGRVQAPQAKAYLETALERLRGIEGVRAVSLAEVMPFSGVTIGINFRREGQVSRAFVNRTDAEYFSTLGLRTLRGRVYSAAEVQAGAPVAVVNETLARQLWGEDDPIGKVVDGKLLYTPASRITIIGVVSDSLTARLAELRVATIYQPIAQPVVARILIRTDRAPGTIAPSVRAALQTLDPRIRVDTKLITDGLEEEQQSPRIAALLATAVAALALVLATIGIYGVTAFVTGLRTREIGVRLAMGATRGDILRLLLGEGLRPIVIGLGGGAVAALLIGRLFRGVAYGITPHDPASFGIAAAVLIVAALVAVYVPTRRASRLDPAAVLRRA